MFLNKQGRAISRLEGFSDAVFAFSATLLVVSLEVPTTFPALMQELKGFAAFGISFAALMMIWSVHNAFFRRFGLQDAVTKVLNGLLLFVVLFYVYPLKFMVEGLAQFIFGLAGPAMGISSPAEMATVFMLYSGGFVAIFLCVTLLYRHAYRQREVLGLSDEESYWALFYFRHYLIFVVVGLLSVLVAWAGWGLAFGLPGMLYFLLGPLCYGQALWSQKRRPAGVPA